MDNLRDLFQAIDRLNRDEKLQLLAYMDQRIKQWEQEEKTETTSNTEKTDNDSA